MAPEFILLSAMCYPALPIVCCRQLSLVQLLLISELLSKTTTLTLEIYLKSSVHQILLFYPNILCLLTWSLPYFLSRGYNRSCCLQSSDLLFLCNFLYRKPAIATNIWIPGCNLLKVPSPKAQLLRNPYLIAHKVPHFAEKVGVLISVAFQE